MSYLLKKVFAGSVAAIAGLFVFAGTLSAQNRTVTGTVTDDQGEPLIGASVTVEGQSSIGAITDLDGHYTLSGIPAQAEALRYSFIGMEDVVEPINGRTVINVTLSAGSIALNATVVTAMGIRKEEKSLSYNVQQAKLETISPTGSFVNGLNGKVAGVSITQSSAGVGGASRIVMRGAKSINNNNNALYVIDGIPMQSMGGSQPEGIYAGAGQTGDALGSINPDDIESISVLSGPSAAALYGSAAANGVVIITTKKGTKDKVEVNYSNTTEFSRAYVMPRFQNTYAASASGSLLSWGAKMATPGTYNPRNFFRTGLNEVNSLSISTGTERSQTYVSASVSNGRGIIHNNDVDRYNVSIRNTSDLIKDKLTLDMSASYARVLEQNMISQGEYGNPVLPVYLFPSGDDWGRIQVYERYDEARNLKTQYWPYGNDHTAQNPYWITEHQKWNNTKNRLMASAQLSYKPFKWLTISARGKFDRLDAVSERKFDAGTLQLFASKHGYYSKNDSYTEQRFGEVLATVNKYFGDNIVSLSGVVGANIDDIRYSSDFLGGNLALLNNVFTLANIDRTHSGTEIFREGYRSQQRSVFANAQVGFKSMVYLDVTAREDWSSTLNTGGIFYPTVGLSGIITEILPFMKGSILPYWKVRVSYSEVGNSPAASLWLMDPTYSLRDGKVSTSTRVENDNLVPERTKSFEVGTNIHLFDSKLQLDATYYKASTFNQFYNPRTSSTSTKTDIWLNGGQVDNSGVELSLRFNDKVGDFNYEVYGTYSTNTNKIVDLKFTDPLTGEVHDGNGLPVGGFGGVNTFLYEGGSLSDVYVTTLKKENGFLYTTHKGMVVADYDEKDMIYAGSTDAKHRIGLGANLSFKGLSLGFLFNARLGGVAISKTQAVLDYYGISQDTADARDRGYVDVMDMRNYDVQGYYQVLGANQGVMSQYVYDATNVRLQEVSLGYSVPINKVVPFIKDLKVSIVGHNLLMLYLKAPFDPELTSSTGTYNQGIDYFMQPSTRSAGFSVKLKF